MQELNFPKYTFRFKSTEKNTLVFDKLRKKFVVCTPEEWVRQHTVEYLLQEKNFSSNLLNVEKQILVRGISKRYDIVSYRSDGSIHLIVECKAPSVAISQETFDQIARYNFTLRAQYLMVTNGINHYFCQMDWQAERYIFLKELPRFVR